MSSRSVDPRGSISAFVACVAAALVLVGLFVVENGRYMNEYLRVSDVAENAARLAGQSVIGIRRGDPHIDLVAARTSALAYMHQQGVSGSVAVTGSGAVEIRAQVSVPFRGLAFLHVGTHNINVVRRARTIDG